MAEDLRRIGAVRGLLVVLAAAAGGFFGLKSLASAHTGSPMDVHVIAPPKPAVVSVPAVHHHHHVHHQTTTATATRTVETPASSVVIRPPIVPGAKQQLKKLRQQAAARAEQIRKAIEQARKRPHIVAPPVSATPQPGVPNTNPGGGVGAPPEPHHTNHTPD